MSVRPIDIQNVVVRTQEIERVHRAQDGAATSGQQAFAIELSRQAEEKSRRVQSPPEAEQDKIRKESERRHQGSEEPMNDETAEAEGGAGERGNVLEEGGTDESGAGPARPGPRGDKVRAGPDECALPGRVIDVEV